MRSDDLVRMAHVYEDLRQQIAIPSVFVGEAASQDLRVIMRWRTVGPRRPAA